MYRIVVNGSEVAAESPRETWGELLDWLDARCSRDGLLVTEVRLDGVDWPAFREPGAAGQALTDAAVIDVDADRPHDLLASTLDQAVVAARGLGEAAGQIGTTLRGTAIARANRDLAEFAATLRTLVSIATTVASALGIALDDVAVEGRTGNRLVGDLVTHADAVIVAQEQEDWITVADIVEYDIAPALEQWPLLFEALRGLVGDPSRRGQ